MLEFQVREGAVGEVAKVTDRSDWRRWTTTKTLNFKEPERRSRTTPTENPLLATVHDFNANERPAGTKRDLVTGVSDHRSYASRNDIEAAPNCELLRCRGWHVPR